MSDPPGISHRDVQANGIRFHVVVAGSGPPVFLLHGFPEFWYSWRHQIPPLAERFTVYVPDLRGYNETEKPRRGYDVGTLCRDVDALASALEAPTFRLVGHDWGGGLAWRYAMDAPHRVERLVITNAPHPTAFARAMLLNPRQRWKSRYILFFQLPWLPERRLSANHYAEIRRIFRDTTGVPGAIADADIERYVEAAAKPGALTAALNYYRAMKWMPAAVLPREIRCPTLVLWGTKDRFLGDDLLQGLERWVPDLRIVRFPEAGHWLPQELPDAFNAHLLPFLSGEPLPDYLPSSTQPEAS